MKCPRCQTEMRHDYFEDYVRDDEYGDYPIMRGQWVCVTPGCSDVVHD